MSKDKSNDLENLLPISKTDEEIADGIVNANDTESLKKLIDLFNFNQTKKNLLRVKTYQEILDKVSTKMLDRVRDRPDEFSNADLLNYLQVTQNAVDKSSKSLSQADAIPSIQLNQINVNVDNGEVLDRESRERVKNIIELLKGKVLNKEVVVEPEPMIIEPENVQEEQSSDLLNGEEGEEN